MLLESYSSIFFETWFLSTKRSAFESVRGIRQTELTVQSEIGIFEITNHKSQITNHKSKIEDRCLRRGRN